MGFLTQVPVCPDPSESLPLGESRHGVGSSGAASGSPELPNADPVPERGGEFDQVLKGMARRHEGRHPGLEKLEK